MIILGVLLFIAIVAFVIIHYSTDYRYSTDDYEPKEVDSLFLEFYAEYPEYCHKHWNYEMTNKEYRKMLDDFGKFLKNKAKEEQRKKSQMGQMKNN